MCHPSPMQDTHGAQQVHLGSWVGSLGLLGTAPHLSIPYVLELREIRMAQGSPHVLRCLSGQTGSLWREPGLGARGVRGCQELCRPEGCGLGVSASAMGTCPSGRPQALRMVWRLLNARGATHRDTGTRTHMVRHTHRDTHTHTHPPSTGTHTDRHMDTHGHIIKPHRHTRPYMDTSHTLTPHNERGSPGTQGVQLG